MNTIRLLGIAGITFLSLAQPTWAGPRGGGSSSSGSGHFGGGGRVGGFAGGGSALRHLSMVAAFEQHRLSGGHTLPVEVSADQVSHLDLTMAALECLL